MITCCDCCDVATKKCDAEIVISLRSIQIRLMRRSYAQLLRKFFNTRNYAIVVKKEATWAETSEERGKMMQCTSLREDEERKDEEKRQWSIHCNRQYSSHRNKWFIYWIGSDMNYFLLRFWARADGVHQQLSCCECIQWWNKESISTGRKLRTTSWNLAWTKSIPADSASIRQISDTLAEDIIIRIVFLRSIDWFDSNWKPCLS